ncbi:hypothetical protein KL905_000273 [Ogataea polymorpha]|uniref:uncharacterized protein n=1 Tax=Ogataea polymorpha TaxID=460523 RepID=UPI0007F3AA9A|nr:uncharacterized protein OGAPODRAFT_16107 [Ogataea polymorpha]KAG7882232.1 hypothetical protein KL937_000803 [Ogataea polymorpha]KAG7891683.1 hypothetical protein KL936_001626 [Ogataea polymorpha]KAG7895036.1 hypothetical protein KL908_001386 [Ogataea polymorpha]KAG7912636.1 hypothetical protein KL907_000838 [Ogataea polymorpha]KAG7924119.1 hypothetical protein KL905_000273 [Ogataea polymorpha]
MAFPSISGTSSGRSSISLENPRSTQVRRKPSVGNVFSSIVNTVRTSVINSTNINSHPTAEESPNPTRAASAGQSSISLPSLSADDSSGPNSERYEQDQTQHNQHNRFDRHLYNLNIANSPTVANLSAYVENSQTRPTLEAPVPVTRLRETNSAPPESPSTDPPANLSAITSEAVEGDSDINMEDLADSMSEGITTPLDAHGAEMEAPKCDENGYYAIRLTPFIDHSSSTPFMYFGPLIRKIKPGMSIMVGRYTEKCKSAATAPQGSSAAVVFKSKVVSRQHAEISVDHNGTWYLKDVCSSSGTFLNHVRLSPANTESRKYVLKDSDILQLGMDYRGGSEDIYRCVKVTVELNSSWCRRTQKFNEEAHERLKKLTLMTSEEEVSPCAICLSAIKPCQAVFVSSCSHSWHYKCIRPIVVKTYPQFLCPNCKAVCDMEADFDEDE